MTQEDKELLFKDLCARLPYDVMVSNNGQQEFLVSTEYGESFVTKDVVTKTPQLTTEEFGGRRHIRDIEEIKPYLRPMSSMTEEEGVEWRELLATYPLCAEFNTDNRAWLIAHSDFILSHHFDFWNLIEKGLALEAPEGMYKIN